MFEIKIALIFISFCCIVKRSAEYRGGSPLPYGAENGTLLEQTLSPTAKHTDDILPRESVLRNFSEINYKINTTTIRPLPTESTGNHRRVPEGMTAHEILLVCGFGFTFVVGILGNCFVCYFFGFKIRKKKRTVTETLIFYLGFVDLLASIVNPLLYTYWTVTKYRRWDFGVLGCKIFAPLAPITVTVSASIIMLICIDRYRAIVSPFNGQFSKRQVNMAMSVAVTISVLFHTSYIHYLEVKTGTPCFVAYGGDLGFAVPYIIGTVLRDLSYTCVFCFTSVFISKRLKQRHDANVNIDFSMKCRKESRRIVRVLYRVGLIFAILVFPKDFLSVISTISWLSPPGIPSTKVLMHVNAWLKVLNVSNSCANIFIYSHVHNRFKREIWKIFGKFTHRKHFQSIGGQTLTTECNGEMYEVATNCQNSDFEGNNRRHLGGHKTSNL